MPRSEREAPETAPVDAFTRAYLAGNDEDLADASAAPPGPGGGHPAAAAAPGGAVALGGQLITAEGAQRGWLVIENGRIADIRTRKPTGVSTLDTDGVILPGLIDLHGHPEFNVFAPWEPPVSFANRYRWRASESYRALVRDPQNKLIEAVPSGTQLRYAEIRALVGGVTAIQGASGRTTGSRRESLVRNVDGVIFGEHRGRSLIDLPDALTGFGSDGLVRILAAIGAGDVDAFFVHLAEGRHDDEVSQAEFAHLVELGALTSSTVIIHGTAMTHEEFGAAADAGAGLVWSPQSNLRLYGETTHAADALDTGLTVGLGADWLPSGSTSLLAEMKVARQELANQDSEISAQDLVSMVTSTAAALAGLDDRLGSLEVGRPADVVVMTRQDDDPYESVCAASPNDVELVLVDGDLTYGRSDWIRQVAAEPDDLRLEPILAWGRPMLLDTRFEVEVGDEDAPTLQQIRTDLVDAYPPVGPIWA